MGNINIQVFVNSSDKTTYVIEYTRNQQICNGIGTLDISFIPDIAITLLPYQEIVLWEEGVKKGTYYITTISQEAISGKVTCNCQDKSKRMQDYWLSTNYSTDISLSTRYWIAKILDEAGIDYNFNVDGTSYMNPDTSFGICSASDIITTLLQDSGWYIYFDADGTAQIGDLHKNTDNYSWFLDDSSILSIDTVKHDKMLRNRAVAWGRSNPITHEWVYADMRKRTPWDYDSNDLRSWLISNGKIDSVDSAAILASKGLKEFAQINYEKTIIFTGAPNISLGDIVYVDSKYFTGAGLITTITTSLSEIDGLRTTVILNQRCPRLFGFITYENPVYIGTKDQGVWKKPLITSHIWSEYNTGLPIDDRSIIDLAVNASTLVCVTEKGNAYFRTQNDYGWRKFTPHWFVDVDNIGFPITYNLDELKAVACDINKLTNEIYVGYKGQKTGQPYQSFIVTADSLLKYSVSLVKDDLNNRYYDLHDLTTNNDKLIISASPYMTNMGEVLYATGYRGINREELTNIIPGDAQLSSNTDSTLITNNYTNVVFWDKYAYFYHRITVGGVVQYFVVRLDMEYQTTVDINLNDVIAPGSPWSFSVDKDGNMILNYHITANSSDIYSFYSINFETTTITHLVDYDLSLIWANYPDHNADHWVGLGQMSTALGYTTMHWHTMFKLTENKFLTLISPKQCEVRGVVINISTNTVNSITLAIGDDLNQEPTPPPLGSHWIIQWTVESQPVIMNEKLYMTFGRGLVLVGGVG